MEGDDKSKYAYVDTLRSIQLSFRIANRLCIFCGGQAGAVALACSGCAEERRRKRIVEYEYDYLEDER